jgi:hypothetical protein
LAVKIRWQYLREQAPNRVVIATLRHYLLFY